MPEGGQAAVAGAVPPEDAVIDGPLVDHDRLDLAPAEHHVGLLGHGVTDRGVRERGPPGLVGKSGTGRGRRAPDGPPGEQGDDDRDENPGAACRAHSWSSATGVAVPPGAPNCRWRWGRSQAGPPARRPVATTIASDRILWGVQR